MSISFTSVHLNRVRHIMNISVHAAQGFRISADALELQNNFEDRWCQYLRYVKAYRDGEMRMSDLRKQHRAMCDFLDDAARRYPQLDLI